MESIPFSVKAEKPKATREQAMRVARQLGCSGAHEGEDGNWMPCGSHQEYEAIKKGKEEYLKVLASKKKKPLPKMVQRTKRLETKSDAYYENRADALSISKIRGCGGVRTVMLAGKRYYTPCDHKPRKGWEKLDEKPITGIATLPGGGLVTGSFSGKSLGLTVGEISRGKTPIDGDGDGFITRRGKDNVPAPLQSVKRTLQDKLKQGPLKFVGGLDSGRNIPRVLNDEESRTRYGRTKKSMTEYMQKKYGIKIDFAEETKEQKIARAQKIKAGAAESNPNLSPKEISALASRINKTITERIKLTKELWRYLENPDTKETDKDLDLRQNTYPFFYEQARRMEAEIHGALQGLEDVLSNINLPDEEKSKISVRLTIFDLVDPHAENEGFVRVHRDDAGNPTIEMNVLTKAWAPDIEYDDAKVVASNNTYALDPNDAPEQVGARFEVPVRKGDEKTIAEIRRDIRKSLEDMPIGEFDRRKGYATTVHEFAHVLDALAIQNLNKWVQNNPDDKEAKDFLGRIKLMENIANNGDPEGEIRAEFLSVALRDLMGENPQISKYAKFNEMERAAEQFTAWFIFAKADGISGDEEMRERNDADNAKDILRLPLEMFMKSVNREPKLTVVNKISSNFEEILSRNHPVGQFIFGGLKQKNLKASEGKEKPVEKKGFVNFVSRSTDPDTFSDPESARIRSRNLGCIGIRRYTARDGKLVWMPCTNVSDYNRVTGIRGDNSPRNNPRRQGSGFKKKALGDPIGGSIASSGNKPIDGDGDGFVASTPGGVDDTRVSPKQEKRPKGEITKGNIDLNNRPVVKNRDGSISTVRSLTITEGNTAVVIPTVIKKPDGSGVIVSDQQAIRHYQRSGQHLGKFSNIRDADTYARNLHNQQAAQYPNPGKSFIGGGVLSFKGVPKPKKKPPTVTSTDINNLAIRVRNHNGKAKPAQRANLRDLKNIYLRGLEDGDKASANKRVSKFLSLLMSDKPKDVKYFDDNDLLPLDHPWRNRKTTKKWAGFDDGEYGVKYAEKCCPQVVKRYHAK